MPSRLKGSKAVICAVMSLAAWAAALVAAEQPVPPLTGRVIDSAGIIAAAEQSALEAGAARIEQEYGSQVVVLIVSTLASEAIESYALRVVESWQLGRKGVDDGVLLLIAVEDRKLRIEVGYGLEGALPDAVSKRIISEIITPHFKESRYYQGIAAGLEAIQKSIAGEELPLPAPPDSQLLDFVVFLLSFLGLWGLIWYFGSRYGDSSQGRGSGRSGPVGGWSSGGFRSSGGSFGGGGGSFGGGGASGGW